MGIEVIWLKHLRALVLEASGGKEITREGRTTVADALGRSEQAIYQVLEGKAGRNGKPRTVSKGLAELMARRYARGRPAGWINIDPDAPSELEPRPLLPQGPMGLTGPTQRYAQHLANLLEDITDLAARRVAYNAAVEAIINSGTGESPNGTLGNGTDG